MARQVSQVGIDLVKSFEGCRLTAYKCVSTEKYYTIGYGHYGADVQRGQTITKKQAEELLVQDLQKSVANVNKYMSKYNFNQNQFDALVSFAYNVGSINQLTASGTRSIEVISSKIPAYNKSGGKVLQGLVRRRAKEKELFDTPTGESVSKPASTVTTPKKKTNEQIAKEVVAGKWGTGNARKCALEKAGYNYKEIQTLVNKLLKK